MSAVTRRGALSLLPAAGALLWPSRARAKPISRNMLADARQHYEAFAAILDEAVGDFDGWVIRGAARVGPCLKVQARDSLSIAVVRYETGAEPRAPDLVIERHLEMVGLCRDFGGWNAELRAWEREKAIWLPKLHPGIDQ